MTHFSSDFHFEKIELWREYHSFSDNFITLNSSKKISISPQFPKKIESIFIKKITNIKNSPKKSQIRSISLAFLYSKTMNNIVFLSWLRSRRKRHISFFLLILFVFCSLASPKTLTSGFILTWFTKWIWERIAKWISIDICIEVLFVLFLGSISFQEAFSVALIKKTFFFYLDDTLLEWIARKFTLIETALEAILIEPKILKTRDSLIEIIGIVEIIEIAILFQTQPKPWVQWGLQGIWGGLGGEGHGERLRVHLGGLAVSAGWTLGHAGS